MKNLNLALATLTIWLTAISPAFAAASTNKVYNSGILVLIFVGFCALVVVAQMIPAMMTLWGMIKGALSARKQEGAEARAMK